jgi:chitodextrinase
VSNVSTSGFRVTWSPSKDNVAVTGYNVYRNGTYVGSVTSNSAVFSGLKHSTMYRIQVLAHDVRMNKSVRSTELIVRTLALADTIAPTVPSGLVVSNLTKNGFRVTWNASKDNVGVRGYNVYRNGKYVTAVTGRAITFSGMKADTIYKIQVLAFDQRMNKSARSRELQVKTLR